MALFILVVIFLAIWSSEATQTQVTQPYFLAQDTIDLLQSTQVKDFSSHPSVLHLINNRNITDYELTILEQMALFHLKDTQDPGSYNVSLRNFSEVILQNLTPIQYSFQFIIDERVVYTQISPLSEEQNNSESLVSSRTIVAVVDNKTELSPPFVAEVRVWQ
ncbi:hypothetical protein GF345_00340 [Candidatus Woesearchaeota archaeon]|nr:hypothetical protein [Candidatus Woesearchaeota archaeon]